MAANGSELFLDRNTRVRKIQQIAAFLAQIEGKDPHVRAKQGWIGEGGGGGVVASAVLSAPAAGGGAD